MSQVEHWIQMGIEFGYPSCCIESFIELRHIKDQVVRKLNGTGFVPCARCNLLKSEDQLIKEINKNRWPEHGKFKDVEPKGMYIVVGKTECRVYGVTGIPLHRLNYSYKKNREAIEFYITPILDI